MITIQPYEGFLRERTVSISLLGDLIDWAKVHYFFEPTEIYSKNFWYIVWFLAKKLRPLIEGGVGIVRIFFR